MTRKISDLSPNELASLHHNMLDLHDSMEALAATYIPSMAFREGVISMRITTRMAQLAHASAELLEQAFKMLIQHASDDLDGYKPVHNLSELLEALQDAETLHRRSEYAIRLSDTYKEDCAFYSYEMEGDLKSLHSYLLAYGDKQSYLANKYNLLEASSSNEAMKVELHYELLRHLAHCVFEALYLYGNSKQDMRHHFSAGTRVDSAICKDVMNGGYWMNEAESMERFLDEYVRTSSSIRGALEKVVANNFRVSDNPVICEGMRSRYCALYESSDDFAVMYYLYSLLTK